MTWNKLERKQGNLEQQNFSFFPFLNIFYAAIFFLKLK